MYAVQITTSDANLLNTAAGIFTLVIIALFAILIAKNPKPCQ